MAARRMMLPDYGTVSMKGTQYYRTRVTDQQGRRVSLYARTREELYQKEQEAIQQIENKTYRRSTPTVEEYYEKWLLMQSAQIRMTTLIDYTSKVKNYIIKPLGDMHMGDVTADDIRLALLAASKKSASVYKSVNVLYKCIFTAAMESKIIDENPTIYLKKNVGGIPQKDRLPLTDEQVDKLLDAIYGLPPYVFVMLGLYAGLRREEILGLQWDSVYLDCEAPYLTVRRAWHTEHNRPVILTELKTKAAHRNVPLPDNLLECLKEAKKTSTSDYVVANRDGDPLSYTQFKRLWQYIVTRTTKERCYYRYEDGKHHMPRWETNGVFFAPNQTIQSIEKIRTNSMDNNIQHINHIFYHGYIIGHIMGCAYDRSCAVSCTVTPHSAFGFAFGFENYRLTFTHTYAIILYVRSEGELFVEATAG